MRGQNAQSIKIVLSVLLFLLLTFGLSFGPIRTYGQVSLKTYFDDQCGIAIDYPSDWQVLHVGGSIGDMKTLVSFQPIKSSGSTVEIEMNGLSLISDKTLEGVTNYEQENIRTFEDRIDTSEQTQVSGHPAQKLVLVEPLPGYSEKDWSKKMLIYTIAFGKEYKLTFNANNPAQYKKFISKFEQMLPTFKIDEPKFEGADCEQFYNTVTADNATGLRSYRNLNHNVSAKYPDDWSYSELGYSEAYPERTFIVLFTSPFATEWTPNEIKSNMTSFSVSIENLQPASMTLEKYKDKIVKDLEKRASEVRDVKVTPTSFAGSPAYQIEDMRWYTDHWEKEGSIYTIKNGKSYAMSWNGVQESVDNYADVIKKMIASIRFPV